MTIGFITHADCQHHDMGHGHPECPARIQAIVDQLKSSALYPHLKRYDANLASKEQLCQAHDAAYVETIFKLSPKQNAHVQLDPDTVMNPHTLNAARRAAGAVVQAVDLVMNGKHGQVFCCVRPPGHHAEHHKAMGFCFFNNIAVGVYHALNHWNITRAAVVDFDVHHGNGSEDILKRESRVLFCSTFQHPYYPYSGTTPESSNCISVPLPAYTTSEPYRDAVRKQLLPPLASFKPQLIFISAGFDGHKDDPLAQHQLNEADYAWITHEIKTIADQWAQGRIISSLEGGYDLQALALSVQAHLHALHGDI